MWTVLLAGLVFVSSVDGLTHYEATVRLRNNEYQKMVVPARNIQNAREMLYMQWCPKTNNCILAGPFPIR